MIVDAIKAYENRLIEEVEFFEAMNRAADQCGYESGVVTHALLRARRQVALFDQYVTRPIKMDMDIDYQATTPAASVAEGGE